MNRTVSPTLVLQGLHLDQASEASRLRVLHALILYGWETGDNELAAAARLALPHADPRLPPDDWLQQFCAAGPDGSAESRHADALAFWQGLDDDQRQERLVNPTLAQRDSRPDGRADGAAQGGGVAGRTQAGR